MSAARCLNVCVEHQPAHAGLYRGIQDFARALPGGILSFDGVLPGPPHDPAVPVIRRIRCGSGWLCRRCHAIAPEAMRAADEAAADADLLAVHSLFRGHCRWAWQWAARHRRPYWVVPHGCLDPVGLSRRQWLKRFWMRRDGRQLFADAAAIVFATRREMAKAAAWLPGLVGNGAGRSRTSTGVVIPWPVEVPSLAGADTARAAIRDRLEIPADARILLWVGRFHATKRPLEAMHAFAAADARHCHLVMVGLDETLTRAYVQAAIPERCAGRVHVLGELRGASLAEAWLAADGYISLSAKENFGYTAADALAHGLPVILSPGHDLAYELPGADEGRLGCGWLLPNDSSQAAAQAIREWSEIGSGARDAARRLETLGASGRSWAAEHLSFGRFQASLEALAAGHGTVAPSDAPPS